MKALCALQAKEATVSQNPDPMRVDTLKPERIAAFAGEARGLLL